MCNQTIRDVEVIQSELDEIKQIAQAIEKLSNPLTSLKMHEIK